MTPAEITRLRKITSDAIPGEADPNWKSILRLQNFQQAVAPSRVLEILDELQKARVARDLARDLLRETDESWNRLCHGYRKMIAGKTVGGMKNLEESVDHIRAKIVTELERKGD